MTAARTLVSVPGAEAALRDAAAQLATGADAAAAVLADAADRLDLREAEETSRVQGRGVLVAADDDGPVLAVRCFAPGEETTIHDHGTAGIAVVRRGLTRCERWSAGPEGARLQGLGEVTAGQWMRWEAPPGDTHRQVAGPDGSLELIMLGTVPGEPREFEPDRSVLPLAVQALATYDIRALSARYRDDVLFDANVPQWRYQLQGPAAVLEMVDEELGALEGLVVSGLRASYADSAVSVEVAVRFGAGDQTHRWREVHLLQTEADLIVEHTVYCTGIWEPATIARHAAEAPMIRP